MKILITGTAGFIGFHLAKRLLERGDTVVGIDNINDYYDVNLKYARLAKMGISRDAVQWHKKIQSTKYPGYSFVRMNLEHRKHLSRLFENEKFDKVCNLAAQAGVRYSLENPHAYINSNIIGFMNILEACRHYNIQHLVYASSSSVYGNKKIMPLSTSDFVDHPISLYAATKKSNELMAYTYSHLFGIPSTGLRFFTVYGPWGRPDMALFLFTKNILNGKPIKVFNYGNMVRDFTYIDDIIEGVTRVIDNPPKSYRTEKNIPATSTYSLVACSSQLENPTARKTHELNASTAPYKIYNIGNSSPVNLLEFIAAIEYHLGKTSVKEMLPMQPGDVSRTEADVTDLVDDFGYRPNTPVTKGIGEFVKWYREFYSV
ncbi:MAG: NAD-dependent epimerase [Bacteroidales bacterium]|nr:NAD-dependent epimerase [Bacteroidales bacterium]